MATFTEDSVTEMRVLGDGHIEVKRIDRVLRDGVLISEIPHRHVLSPGDDLGDQHERVAAVAKSVWTDDVVKSHKAKMAESRAALMRSVAKG